MKATIDPGNLEKATWAPFNSRLSTRPILCAVMDSNALKRAHFSMQRTIEIYLLNWFAPHNASAELCLLTKANGALRLEMATKKKLIAAVTGIYAIRIEKLNLS